MTVDGIGRREFIDIVNIYVEDTTLLKSDVLPYLNERTAVIVFETVDNEPVQPMVWVPCAWLNRRLPDHTFAGDYELFSVPVAAFRAVVFAQMIVEVAEFVMLSLVISTDVLENEVDALDPALRLLIPMLETYRQV